MKAKDNKEIGQYLVKLIERSEYKNERKFCSAWLKYEGNDCFDDTDEIRKRQNKFICIKNGKQSLSLDDISAVSELLGVSFEEILTAGDIRKPNEKRLSNYYVSFSKDPSVWEKYLELDETIFLNFDEYGKSIIDYAIECENYEFLKYLIDNDIIWLAKDLDESVHYLTAGTKIEPRHFAMTDIRSEFSRNKLLREKIISLAIKNRDFDILDTLKAREIPDMYQYCSIGDNKSLFDIYGEPELIKRIAKANKEVRDYFSTTFTVNCDRNDYVYIYPFLGNVIEQMIKDKSKNVDEMLTSAIAHNKKMLEILDNTVEEEHKAYNENMMKGFEKKSEIEKAFIREKIENGPYNDIWKGSITVYFNDSIVWMHVYYKKKTLMLNFIQVQAKSTNEKTDGLITELNALYQKGMNYKEDLISGKDGK